MSVALVLAVAACAGVVGLALYAWWDYRAGKMDGEDTIRKWAREVRRRQ